MKKLHQVVDQNRVLRLGNGLSFQLRQFTQFCPAYQKLEFFNRRSCSHMAMLRASRYGLWARFALTSMQYGLRLPNYGIEAGSGAQRFQAKLG